MSDDLSRQHFQMQFLFQNELLSLTEAPAVEEVVSSHGQLLLDRIMRVSVSPGPEVIKKSCSPQLSMKFICL